MTWTLVDTGLRGQIADADSTKRRPAMLDGYYLFPPDTTPNVPGDRIALEAAPDGWDELVTLSRGLSYTAPQPVALARVLLRQVTA